METQVAEDSEGAIREVLHRWVRAERDGDWASWAALLTEDAVQIPPNSPPIEGRQAVRAWAEAFPRITEVSMEPSRIEVAGSLAYHRGVYSITVQPDPDLAPLTDTGTYVQVLRRDAFEAWRVAVGIWNSDSAGPIPADERTVERD